MTSLRWGVLSTADIARRKVIPGIAARPPAATSWRSPRATAPSARAVAAELGIPTAHGSYEALLADPDVDAVYIPLPNHLHAEWTIAAARAGKHVLCEKPLALTAAEAERMVDACARAGVRLMEAFMYRHHPSWVAATALVAVRPDRRAARGPELVLVLQRRPRQHPQPGRVRRRRPVRHRLLLDQPVADAVRRGAASGSAPRSSASPTTGVDVLTSAILEFEAGVATFTCSTRVETDQRVHIYGTEGRLSIEIPFNIPPDRPTRIVVDGRRRPARGAGDRDARPSPTADPYTVEAERFAAAILDGTPTPTPPEDAVANLRVIERIFAAATLRRRSRSARPTVFAMLRAGRPIPVARMTEPERSTVGIRTATGGAPRRRSRSRSVGRSPSSARARRRLVGIAFGSRGARHLGAAAVRRRDRDRRGRARPTTGEYPYFGRRRGRGLRLRWRRPARPVPRRRRRPGRAVSGTTAPVGGPCGSARSTTPRPTSTGVTGAYPLDIDGDGIVDLAVLRNGENVLLRGLGGCRFERANERWAVRRRDRLHDGVQRDLGGLGRACRRWPSATTSRPGSSSDPDHLCADNDLVRPGGRRDAYAAPIAADPVAGARCRCSSATGTGPADGTSGSATTGTTTATSDGQEQLWRIEPGEAPRLYTADDGWATVQIQGMGIASYDLTGDGYPEVYLTSQGDERAPDAADGPSEPTYRDIGLKRGVTPTRPFTGGDSLPSTAWHPEFDDVNNDGFIDLFVAKGNVGEQTDYAMQGPQRPVPRPARRDVQRGRGGGRDPQLRRAVAGPRSSTSTSTACSTSSRSTDGAPVGLWRNVGRGRRRGAGADGPLARGRASTSPAPNRDAIGAWLEVRVGDATIAAGAHRRRRPRRRPARLGPRRARAGDAARGPRPVAGRRRRALDRRRRRTSS